MNLLEQTPGKIHSDVDAVIDDGVTHGADMLVEELLPKEIVLGLLERQILLAVDGEPVFKDANHLTGRLGVGLPDVVEELAHAPGDWRCQLWH